MSNYICSHCHEKIKNEHDFVECDKCSNKLCSDCVDNCETCSIEDEDDEDEDFKDLEKLFNIKEDEE